MTHINKRRDTAANFASINPVLMLGEEGYETDTRKSKTGNGVDAYNDLGYDRGYGSKADVGLDQVDNTSDLDKPISTSTATALNSKADLASPALTGSPTVPTRTAGDSSTKIANTAWVQGELLDYAPIDSPAFTGNPTVPTATAGDNDDSIASTAFVQNAINSKIINSSGSIVIGSLLIQWFSTTVSGSSIAAGALATSSVTWPVAFSSNPYYANVGITTFVSGSSGIVCKGVDSLTATSGRVVHLNTSDVAATYTNLGVTIIAFGPA